MRRGCPAWVPFVLLAAAPWSGQAPGEDDDKSRLFNTFYSSGEEESWVLILRQDRSFEISSPDGTRSSGTFHASDKEIGIASRHLAYKFDGTNVVFLPSKKDAPGNDLAGRMPPQGKEKATYLSLQNWKKLGKAPRAPVPGKEPKPTVPAMPEPLPAAPGVRPATIAGSYAMQDAQARTHTLRLAESGTFEYAAPDARKASGTFACLDGELTLDSGFHRRHMALTLDPLGLQVSRRDTDPLKPGDCLGEMPHQDRSTVLWKKEPAQSSGEQVPPPAKPPLEPRPPLAPDPRPQNPPLVSCNPPTPNAEPPASATHAQRAVELFKAGDKAGAAEAYTLAAEAAERAGNLEEAKRFRQNAFALREMKPPPVPPVAPVAPVAPVSPPTPKPLPPVAVPPVEKPPAPARTLAEIAGAYSYRPNPLVTESWTLQADGAFEYADSNGAKIAGTAQWEGDVLSLRSGEVVRRFSVATDGGALILTRVADDNPKITNDLATMSPSVLKSAKYEKKK